ncbi:U6 snRNA phosphodiesterase, putative (USB1) [Plasmodium ovale wallikeri]|uniref:U6 snRNA phosphodiesterase 1 n=2 Tax=Plasmodium ovale TaxID=36330 RepID=A0A1A8Z9V1_PLAOA|nr:U6 snRNA phosphodiesterase, putative (USB1) [Plasmodium ovale wallikeri]SBT40610.1 U6 snRNA phosphodiesterase, putative (USB1) [Plasmodium ovale wallikeri]SBT77992.1 U6 snRNA phosphodiesterase, putative [Plasmodium ovale]
MSNQGDFNSYIYIPVRSSEEVRKRAKVCHAVLRKLVEKQFALGTGQWKDPSFCLGKGGETQKGEISRHLFYQLDSLNVDGRKQEEMEEEMEEKMAEKMAEEDFKDPLHVTIAGSVHVKRHMITSFIGKIREELNNQYSFHLFFGGNVDLYRSQKHTKYFCAHSVKREQQELYINSLIGKINKILNHFGLTNDYVDRICHVSLAYTDICLDFLLQNKNLDINSTFWPNIEKIIKDEYATDEDVTTYDDFYIYVNRICVRVGKKVYVIPFKHFDNEFDYTESNDSGGSSSEK